MNFDSQPPPRDEIQKAISAAEDHYQAASAIFLYEKWLNKNSEDNWWYSRVLSDYGTLLYKLTRFEDAIQQFEIVLSKFPERRWFILNQLGQLCRYRGDLAKAQYWYQQAIEENPSEASSYIFLGATQARQGNLKEAELSHREGTRCEKGPVDEAYYNLGLVLRSQERFTEAKECLGQAISIDPNYAQASQALADVEFVIKNSTTNDQ